MLNRRQFISATTSAFFAPCAVAAASDSSPTLRAAAKKRGLLYGAAVNSERLAQDQNFSELVASQANILVAEGETKRKAMQPTPTRFDFSGTDKILAFAHKHDQQMRGHTLAWHYGNPDWLLRALKENPPDSILTDYITTVVGRYRGQLQSWDVVNEAVDPGAGRPDGMRGSSPWFQAFGENYIDLAFHAARQADPNTPLYMNELDTEIDVRWSQNQRTASLALLDRLIARKVPIDGYGIQGHLKAFLVSYSDEIFSKYLDELGSRGLQVMITELDIADIGGPADQTKRDAEVASLARRFLDVAFSKPFVKGCLTWGITNRYTWLAGENRYKWPDGRLPRALPFDENYQPIPMHAGMLASYGA
jgi:endo-1,4-beta-xylanase